MRSFIPVLYTLAYSAFFLSINRSQCHKQLYAYIDVTCFTLCIFTLIKKKRTVISSSWTFFYIYRELLLRRDCLVSSRACSIARSSKWSRSKWFRSEDEERGREVDGRKVSCQRIGGWLRLRNRAIDRRNRIYGFA